MELLQNRRYKFEEITISYLYEVKVQIESIIELCREAEISVHETECIILNEYICSVSYHNELWEKLDNFDKGIENDYTLSPEGFKILGFKAAYSDLIKKDIQEIIDILSTYTIFLFGIDKELSDILKSDDYQQKRKLKIKLQFEKDRFELPEKAEIPHSQIHKTKMTDPLVCLLKKRFSEFEIDYPLLIKEGFFEETENGLRLGSRKAKQFLTDYFKSIKPKTMKEISWQDLELIFEEKNLSQMAGKPKPTKDFENWIEIKSTLASK
jgi:hypothetical protein